MAEHVKTLTTLRNANQSGDNNWVSEIARSELQWGCQPGELSGRARNQLRHAVDQLARSALIVAYRECLTAYAEGSRAEVVEILEGKPVPDKHRDLMKQLLQLIEGTNEELLIAVALVKVYNYMASTLLGHDVAIGLRNGEYVFNRPIEAS